MNSAADPTNLVQTSVEKKQPILVVTLNYRLNVFAFGDGSSEKNLALSDQRAALDFIKKHIGDFGGDPVRTPPMILTRLLSFC